MSLVFNLGSLPELQRLDKRRRSRAILDWRIALWEGWKGWTVYFLEIGILIGVIAIFRVLWHFTDIHWPWYGDIVWILPAVLTALVARNHLIYLRRRDVLARILEGPEYAP